MERYKYKLKDITDVEGVAHTVRCYVEQRRLRDLLSAFSIVGDKACEIGCGYGRMTQVLTEFFQSVYGFEREIEFVEIAKAFIPSVNFEAIESLGSIPVLDESFNLVVTHTVLQHLHEVELAQAIVEIKRIVARKGHVLLTEETDNSIQHHVAGNFSVHGTTGRPVEFYQELLKPLELIHVRERFIEPTYSRKDVGHLMLFKKV